MKYLPKHLPYEGDEPYIFVSYSHKNSTDVFSILKPLFNEGYRFWYDEGIDPGDRWETIEKHLQKAALMLLFLSPEAVKANWVRREIDFADKENMRIVAIHLRETKLPSDIVVLLDSVQMIHYNRELSKSFYMKMKKGLPSKTKNASMYESVLCSFCGKPHKDVEYLIAGPEIFICNECVDLCNVILAEARESKQKKKKKITVPSTQ